MLPERLENKTKSQAHVLSTFLYLVAYMQSPHGHGHWTWTVTIPAMTKMGISFRDDMKDSMYVDTVDVSASEHVKLLYRNGMLNPGDVR